MFSTLPYNNKALCKDSHIIHFAAEYNEMYVMPDDWLEEFENLLMFLFAILAVISPNYWYF